MNISSDPPACSHKHRFWFFVSLQYM